MLRHEGLIRPTGSSGRPRLLEVQIVDDGRMRVPQRGTPLAQMRMIERPIAMPLRDRDAAILFPGE
jgi:hypothetical protein